ncbi:MULTISPECIES: orotate phosphoribosyltransferase [unclassified Nostoc]|jgi:orotate phosphoribosyltransferase|uniref:orotate phosphoribosyltransferase n=1 Tax=unclassified Nostoc TaxID=2593658 RepID=UPI000B95487A|nr:MULTISPECIES: orotate phosphoribosyltransferase [unclassified Nostoc]MDZ7944972.1 orotate phosphoribosyltransferase [Nostoc sp. EfeVER01]MDZ7992621.1 orotate phosphoribosyltransferase [Nostoc sp. EspVER01]MDZ8070444.1 orotate phosphoribosyltransferase [Nostoc sp. DedQUE08]MDZ8134311.1 orotate phosphoribosyltransferase [Nostoc sp. DedQUE04]OYD97530.1 orotate phosphoribosyltransferase [Nostoc sp. 'Peltigera membranacea cyanobiont' 210A]
MTYPTETLTHSDIWATTSDLTTLRHKLLDLFCQLAYQEGDFLLSSGLRSSYYVNKTQVTLHPQGALAVGRLLFPLLPVDTQAVGGLTMGADPIVTAVSIVSVYENRPIPALIIRKEAKGYGTRAYIEGPSLPEGAKVVVLEDVVTTGQSALKAVERLKDAGYTVNQVISLVDRQQGGGELYQSAGLKFETLFSIQEVQERYRQLANS